MDTENVHIASLERFAPEQSLKTSSIAEALEACETMFCYTRSPIEAADLVLDDDLGLSFNSGRYQPTEKAFDDLCHILEIPITFAKDIPHDLVATIVERLKMRRQQTIIPVHRDDLVVGVIDPMKWSRSRAKENPTEEKKQRPLFAPVPTQEILKLVQTTWGEMAETPCILMTDTGVKIDVMSAPVAIEPRPGDITHLGLEITTSETGGPMPQARGYTLRLVCSNGAVLPHDFKALRFSTDWRVKMERRLEAFAKALQAIAFDMDRLCTAYQRLTVEPITNEFFFRLHRQARYIYRRIPHEDGDADPADTVLGVEKSRREQIIKQVRDRQEELRKTPTVLATPEPTELAAWDVFNTITAIAREEGAYQRRIALEHLAGDVLHPFVPASLN